MHLDGWPRVLVDKGGEDRLILVPAEELRPAEALSWPERRVRTRAEAVALLALSPEQSASDIAAPCP